MRRIRFRVKSICRPRQTVCRISRSIAWFANRFEALSIEGSATDVPLVSSRVGIQALTSVFVLSALLSIVFYGKLLVFKIG